MYKKIETFDFLNLNIGNLQVTDILEIEYIQRMQDLFSDATGVASLITYPDGRPITTPSNFCRLSKDIIYKTEIGKENCAKSIAGFSSFNLNEPIFRPCASIGLREAGIAIHVGKTHFANWIIGQVRCEKADIKAIIEYAEEIGADKYKFFKAWNEIPVMTESQFKKIAEMLLVFVNDISEKAYLNFQQKKEISEQKIAAEVLQKSQDSLSITLNSIGDGVISTDVNGNVAEMNPVAEKLCGWLLSDARGRSLAEVFKIINANSREVVENPVNNVLKTGKVLGLANHTILVSKTGDEYQIADSAAPIKNKDGVIIGVVLVFSDVTEKYISQNALEESERSKSVLLWNLPGLSYRCKYDHEWTMEFVSQGCVELTGYQPSELENNSRLSFNDMILPEFHPYLWETWQHAIEFKKSVTVEYIIQTLDKTEKWVWEQGIPIYNDNGDVVALEGLILDITERKANEAELIEKDHFLSQIQLIAQLGIYSFDLISNQWTSSAIMDTIFGIDCDYDKSLQGWSDIIHPDWQEIMTDYLQNKVVAEKGIFDKKYKIIRKNDFAERWVHGKGELIFDGDGLPVRMIGTVQDITDRIDAENTLRKSEEKYRNIFDNIQDVFFQIDSNGLIHEITPSVKFYSDFDREEMIGRSVKELYSNPSDRDQYLKKIEVTGELRDYEVNLKTKSGTTRNGSLNARLVLDTDGNIAYIIGSIRDITRRKMTENALRESEKKFHDYIKFAPHGIFISNEKGKYIEVNAAAARITGYSEDELLTMAQFNLIAEESVESYKNHLKNSQQYGYAVDEFVLRHKDKSERFVTVDTVKISENQYIGFVVDITERKLVEKALKSSEKFLKETQLIAQLGTFTIFFDSRKWKSSEILRDIFGLIDGVDHEMESLSEILHPDWSKEVKEYFYTEIIENQSKFDKSFKIIRPIDKQERWVHALGEMVFDNKGNPLKMIGTIQDITSRENLEDALRSSEALYKSILNASPDAIILVDLDGFIQMVSPATLTLYGVTEMYQLEGKNIYDFLVPQDKQRAQFNVARMFEETPGTIEYEVVRSGNTTFYADVNGDVIWDVTGQPTGMLFIIRDISERKNNELSLQKSEKQLKKFASHLQTIREEERQFLAHKIHDELGQILIALKIDLGLLKQKVIKNTKFNAIEDILSKFDNVFELVDNTINTTRKIMTDLSPEVLYMLGFIEGIKFYSKKFEERHKVTCEVKNTILEFPLNSEQSVALFRVYQEALTNIVKHSKATEVKVLLYLTGGLLTLEIVDNGVGFDSHGLTKSNSYGIIGMRERVLLLNGKLSITGKPDNGTRIKVEIPV